MCKAPVKSSPPTNQRPVFLQAGCPSCSETNSVKALKGKISPCTLIAISILVFIICAKLGAVDKPKVYTLLCKHDNSEPCLRNKAANGFIFFFADYCIGKYLGPNALSRVISLFLGTLYCSVMQLTTFSNKLIT